MKLIHDIQNKAGEFFLKKELSSFQRETVLTNLENAKTIGILFESSEKENVDLIKKYVNYLKERRKRVKVIGYHSTKGIPEFTYSRLEYDFFSNKDINWYKKPAGNFFENFINQEFDLLIDLNIYDHFPLRYFAGLSKAKFKVGKFNEQNKNIYDLMIETNSERSFKYFLRQVDTYLDMINKKASA